MRIKSKNQLGLRLQKMSLFITVLFAAAAVLAAPGDLDPTFGNGGKVITTGIGGISDIAIQPDGKIVAAGPGVLARYLSDGSPDATFGGTGKVNGLHGGFIGLQPDGKIVAAGLHDGGDFDMNGFALFRYNVDGSLDNSFGTGGRMIIYGDYGDCCAIGDMVLNPTGGIILVGTVNGEFWGLGFNTDSSFPLNSPKSVVLQEDGKKIVIGFSGDSSFEGFMTARFNTNGSLDSSFDGDGIVQTRMRPDVLEEDLAVQDIAVQSDGRIVVGGCTSLAGEVTCDSFALVRYNPNGSLDTTFDGDGRALTYFGGDMGVTQADLGSIAIESDGKIVAAGYREAGFSEGETDFTLVRYNSDGSLDGTFGGGDGISTVDFNNSNDRAYGMALDAQHRAVVVGESSGAFAIARILLNPTEEVSISGRVTVNGRGLGNAVVSMVDSQGVRRIATTSSFGYYSFNNIPGDTYNIAVRSKRYQFLPQSIFAGEDLSGIDFISLN